MPYEDQKFNRSRGSVRKPSQTGSYSRPPARPSVSSNSPGGRSSFEEMDRKAKEEEKEEKEKKKKARKRVFKLLSNEALCLAIIFAMIASFNWLASDFTGEYLTMDKTLGLVKLSLVRRAATIEGELSYGNRPNLILTGSADPTKESRMEFSTSPQWQANGNIPVKAVFLGKIESNAAKGTIIDAHGKYKVKLEKNMVASIFRQMQVHLPILPTFQPPTWVKKNQFDGAGVSTDPNVIAPQLPEGQPIGQGLYSRSRSEQIKELHLEQFKPVKRAPYPAQKPGSTGHLGSYRENRIRQPAR